MADLRCCGSDEARPLNPSAAKALFCKHFAARRNDWAPAPPGGSLGVAKVMDLSSTEAKLTRTGYLVGTPQYMSPEQINGVAIDKRSDIYALGVILYEMCTGKPPFRGDTLGQMLIAHLQQILPAIDPKLRNEDVPAGIEFVIRKALAKDPSERYPGVQELLADFERLAAGEPTQAAAWYKEYQPPESSCRGRGPTGETRRGPSGVHPGRRAVGI